MPAKKYLNYIAGRIREVAATVVSAGAADDGKIPALDATGRLDSSVMPVGLGADTRSVLTSEALSAGNLVNVYDNAGTPNVRKADATAEGKEANGFVLAGFGNATNATVYFEGRVTGLTGLTTGRVYLSATTPGLATSAPPATAGNVVQVVGQAIGATEINFEPEEPVTLA